MNKLIFTDQNHAGRVYHLVLERTTVGRAAGNTLVIADSSLSAAHCEILMNGPEVIVRDLDSRNGTYVNGAKLVNQQAQLKAGQFVRFGTVEARLELDRPSTDDTASEMTAVHAMGRIIRDQRRERAMPKPTDPSMTLGSPAPSGDGAHTATSSLATPQGTVMAPARPEPTAAREPEKPSRAKAIVIAVAITAGLIVVLWWWLGGK
jgi:predicted component of type VI protein secretion system